MDLKQDLNTLIRKCQSGLLRYAGRFLKSREEAQDAVQEALIRYIRYSRNLPPGNRPVENPSAWLYKTTRNICLDLLKSARARFEIPFPENTDQASESPDKTCNSPLDAAEKSDAVKHMNKLIENLLSNREQEVLALKFEEEKFCAEIAGITNLSPGNVASILHRAILKLRAAAYRQEKGGDDK